MARMRNSFRYLGSDGFTIIEFLVVITAIGVLASVLFAALAASQAKARDTGRVSDARIIAAP